MVNAVNTLPKNFDPQFLSGGAKHSIKDHAIALSANPTGKPAGRIQTQDENGSERKKSSLTLVLATCLLCCIAISLYGLAGLFGDKISRAGHSASQNRLEMVIANSVLSVPENIVRFSTQRRAGNHQRLELYLHWPSMSGYQDILKESFSSTNKQPSLIFISVEPRTMSLDMSGRIGPIYSKFFHGAPSKGIAGLVRQPLKPEGGFIDEDLFLEAGSPYPFAARCVREGSTIATPFCIRDIHIGKDLMLTYRFHIKHLRDWIQIDRNIRKYVSALMINAPASQ